MVRILDTDTCIEILRGNRNVLERRQSVTDEVATTWITAAELFYGAAKSQASARNKKLLVEFLATLRVIGMDSTAAEKFGQIKAELEQAGQQLADADLLIAAIALTQNATLITGNTRHYQRVAGLQLEDWIRG